VNDPKFKPGDIVLINAALALDSSKHINYSTRYVLERYDIRTVCFTIKSQRTVGGERLYTLEELAPSVEIDERAISEASPNTRRQFMMANKPSFPLPKVCRNSMTEGKFHVGDKVRINVEAIKRHELYIEGSEIAYLFNTGELTGEFTIAQTLQNYGGAAPMYLLAEVGFFTCWAPNIPFHEDYLVPVNAS